jgi:hypothetical protein
MKTKILYLVIVMSVFFLGCKNEEKTEVINKETDIEKYTVSLNVIVKEDDDFQIYYTDKTSADFSEESSLWVKVKGSEISQKVVFTIPEGELPTLFRFDFGLNKEQKDIKLESVEIEYFGKKFIVKGKEIAIYFRPVDDTKVDFETGIIKPIVKNGMGVEPVLYPQEVPLEKELKKLVM